MANASGGDSRLLDELLARQARAHGLAAWCDATGGADQARARCGRARVRCMLALPPAETLTRATQPDAPTRAELAEESARLHTFAGMRGGEAAGSGSGSDRDDDDYAPLSSLADGAADVAALEALGLDTLKAELRRCGAKCGGTLAERAARLFALRGRRRLHAEDAALLPKARQMHALLSAE